MEHCIQYERIKPRARKRHGVSATFRSLASQFHNTAELANGVCCNNATLHIIIGQ